MEEKMGRLLGHGDLRYVILHLLDEKPRHGYEVIKALEELSSGAYSPSPGSIYPTLTFLEEGGFASATIDENKKLYAITAQGRVLLKENRAFVDELMARFAHASERLSRLKHWMGREEAEEIAKTDKSVIRKAMHGLKAELFSFLDAREEQKKKVAAIIDRATEEIRKLKG
jgi:DNA-binding PadR family transcriptional regulator